ncbi:MAG TPA: TadE family protein, partial [Candidatus Limnocylindrales bacterium]|nr:TadE family protein [Candidatus Limnocylindrales bacterium]
MPRLLRHVRRHRPDGQALVEFALVFPIAVIVILGIIIFGLFVFYQQQLTNVAREAARFAAINSATSLCPTVGWRDPQGSDRPQSYPFPIRCDAVENAGKPWPYMTDKARSFAWGLDASTVMINAC